MIHTVAYSFQSSCEETDLDQHEFTCWFELDYAGQAGGPA